MCELQGLGKESFQQRQKKISALMWPQRWWDPSLWWVQWLKPPRSLPCSVLLDRWEPRGMEGSHQHLGSEAEVGQKTAHRAPGRLWAGIHWLCQWHQEGVTTFKAQNLLCLKGRTLLCHFPTPPPCPTGRVLKYMAAKSHLQKIFDEKRSVIY